MTSHSLSVFFILRAFLVFSIFNFSIFQAFLCFILCVDPSPLSPSCWVTSVPLSCGCDGLCAAISLWLVFILFLCSVFTQWFSIVSVFYWLVREFVRLLLLAFLLPLFLLYDHYGIYVVSFFLPYGLSFCLVFLRPFPSCPCACSHHPSSSEISVCPAWVTDVVFPPFRYLRGLLMTITHFMSGNATLGVSLSSCF